MIHPPAGVATTLLALARSAAATLRVQCVCVYSAVSSPSLCHRGACPFFSFIYCGTWKLTYIEFYCSSSGDFKTLEEKDIEKAGSRNFFFSERSFGRVLGGAIRDSR